MKSSIAQYAALRGQAPVLKKPLNESQQAELVEAMQLVQRAQRRLDAAQGALEHHKIPFDVGAWRSLQDSLQEAFKSLPPVMLAHIEATQAGR